jgi:hypothetical protein
MKQPNTYSLMVLSLRFYGNCHNITPPTNIMNLFGNWLNGTQNKDRAHIRVGACALLWSIWRVRNDFIFNKQSFPSFLQVILSSTKINGHSSISRRITKMLILGAPDWQW